MADKQPFVPRAGSINFNVSIRMDVEELMRLTPAQIEAFFAGVGAITAAKAEQDRRATEPPAVGT